MTQFLQSPLLYLHAASCASQGRHFLRAKMLFDERLDGSGSQENMAAYGKAMRLLLPMVTMEYLRLHGAPSMHPLTCAPDPLGLRYSYRSTKSDGSGTSGRRVTVATTPFTDGSMRFANSRLRVGRIR